MQDSTHKSSSTPTIRENEESVDYLDGNVPWGTGKLLGYMCMLIILLQTVLRADTMQD